MKKALMLIMAAALVGMPVDAKKKDKKKKEKSDTPQDAEAVEKGSDENVATEPKED